MKMSKFVLSAICALKGNPGGLLSEVPSKLSGTLTSLVEPGSTFQIVRNIERKKKEKINQVRNYLGKIDFRTSRLYFKGISIKFNSKILN